MRCPECGNENPDELQSCRNCGAPLGESPALEATPPPAPPRTGPRAVLIVVLALFGALFVAMLFLVFPRARATAHKAICRAYVSHLSCALRMYVHDYDECFPPTTNWCDVFDPYVDNREVFVCPAASDLPCGYAFNASLTGASLADVYDPSQTVAIFESDRGWNAAGGQDLLPYEPRHLGGYNFGYVDGHYAWVSEEAISEQCIWNLQSSPNDYSSDHAD